MLALILLLGIGCERAQPMSANPVGSVEPFVSLAKWVYCGPFDKPAETCCLRLAFDAKPNAREASFRFHLEKGGKVWVNGFEAKSHRWGPANKFFGHVKAEFCDFIGRVRPGHNVIAVQLNPSKSLTTCRGMILRGEIVYSDGTRQDIYSSSTTAKAVPSGGAGWTTLEFDDSRWPAAVEVGDVFQPPWSRWGNLPECFCLGEELVRYRDWLQHERTRLGRSLLSSEPENPQARIVYSGDIPGIEVNGEVLPPVIDMHVELADSLARRVDLSNMRKAGVRFVSVEGINRFRLKDGTYDFDMLDLQMMQLLSAYPEAYFFFNYGSGVYEEEWAREHPDECADFAVKTKEQNVYNYNCSKPAPSFASKLYRARGVKIIGEFGRYIRSRPWGRRVIGVWTAFGGSGDGMPAGCYAIPDCGVAMTRAFRLYLTEKYVSNEALQKAWGDSSVTLATAAVPGLKERQGWGGYVRDAADPTDRRTIDYYDCYHREFSDYILTLGKAIKEALPGRLSGAYHGYVILSYNPEGSTARCEEILRSPYVDMLFATTRGYNLTDGLHRNLHSLCRRYGKLSTIEGDIRTHLCYRHKQSQDHWSCKSPAETRATYSKIVANSLMYGSGYHIVGFNAYTNLNSKLVWTDCPETQEPIAQGIRAWRELYGQPPTPLADVAVVLDPNEPWQDGHPAYWPSSITADNLVVHPLQALNFCGYAYDLMAPEDFLLSKQNYKAVVFLNTLNVPAEKRRKLSARVQRPGVTAIWAFAPGLASETGFSSAAMSELTGIRLNYRKEALPYDMKNEKGGVFRFYRAASDFREGPRVFSEDVEASVLARWMDDQTPAYVEKRLQSGATAVFTGVPIRDARQWARHFAAAGCHAFTAPGFLVRRNSRMLEVFSGRNCTVPPESIIQDGQIDQSGVCKVKLERSYSEIRDLLTGELVGRNTDVVTLKSEEPHLWFLETK